MDVGLLTVSFGWLADGEPNADGSIGAEAGADGTA
jgi:hypothetical protein